MEQLLEIKGSGNVNMTGMINDIVPPIEDPMEFDEEDPDNEPLIDAMNETVALICGLCRDNPTKLAEVVKTIASSVAIE